MTPSCLMSAIVIDRFSGYPTTIFIGRDGKVKDVKVNFIAMTPEITKWQVEQFERIIIGLLKEPVVSK